MEKVIYEVQYGRRGMICHARFNSLEMANTVASMTGATMPPYITSYGRVYSSIEEFTENTGIKLGLLCRLGL